MATAQPRPIEDRIIQLLDHFDIPRAHIAGSVPADWQGLTRRYADRLASLSLVCPMGFNPDAVSGMATRVMVCQGDQGPMAERVRAAIANQPDTSLVTLTDYPSLMWSDVAAERRDDLGSQLIEFIERMEQPASAVSSLSPQSGEVAGLTYRVEGVGPPLLLLPLALASSQWEPLLPLLSQQFSNQWC